MKNILLVKFIALGDLIQLIIAINYYKSNNKNDDRLYLVIDKCYIKFLQALSPHIRFVGVNSKNFYSKNIFFILIEFFIISFKLIFCLPFFHNLIIFNKNWRYKVLFIFTKKLFFYKNKKKYFHDSNLRNRIYNFYSQLAGIEAYALDLKKVIHETEKIINQSNIFKSNKINLFDSNQKYVVLNPGGCKNILREDFLRRWPIENYKSLSKKLINNGFKVVLVGDSNDKWILKYFSNIDVISMVGKVNLFQIMDIIKHSYAFVTHDSGLLHLASISSCNKIISIFGPTNSNTVVSPMYSNITIMNPGFELTCAPCYDGFKYANCSNPLCMKLTSVDRVYADILN